jgi:N-acetylglutamate synthase-like GNAT family acetyltransferase
MAMTSPRITEDPGSVTIRAANDDDLAAIELLLTSNDLPIAGVRESLNDFLVAAVGRRIVGVAGVEYCGDYGLLRSAVVAEEWRGRGVARSLIARAIAAACAAGVRALYLLTTTAEQYFVRFGLEVTTRESVPDSIRATVEFKDACPATATVMWLPLSRTVATR